MGMFYTPLKGVLMFPKCNLCFPLVAISLKIWPGSPCRNALSAGGPHSLVCRISAFCSLLFWVKQNCVLKYVRAHTRLLLFLHLNFNNFQSKFACKETDEGRGVWTPPPPPGKSQNYRFLSNTGLDPLKSQSYQASIQCKAIIGTPAKRHLDGISLAGR